MHGRTLSPSQPASQPAAGRRRQRCLACRRHLVPPCHRPVSLCCACGRMTAGAAGKLAGHGPAAIPAITGEVGLVTAAGDADGVSVSHRRNHHTPRGRSSLAAEKARGIAAAGRVTITWIQPGARNARQHTFSALPIAAAHAEII
jgi:hypothetical protein